MYKRALVPLDGSAVAEAILPFILDAGEYLAPLASELSNKAVRVRTRVRRGDPATEIVAEARDAGADLIAMTTHGRSGLGRIVFGSVAEAVLRQARLPVLMMRATEAEVARRLANEAMSSPRSAR